MKALVLATQSGELSAKVALVVAPSYEAPSIQTARSVAVDVAVFIPGSDNYGVALRNELAAQGVDFICLAGYLRLLPKEIIEFFPGKILNIHPALLPSFGGKGIYG